MRHLNKLDARTCTGEDGVPYSLLKSILRTDLRDEFCQFFSDILRSGKVPDEWKCGRLILFLRLNFLRNLQISDPSV